MLQARAVALSKAATELASQAAALSAELAALPDGAFPAAELAHADVGGEVGPPLVPLSDDTRSTMSRMSVAKGSTAVATATGSRVSRLRTDTASVAPLPPMRHSGAAWTDGQSRLSKAPV